MPTTLAEQLVEQFYAWEIRGRGWLLWEEPVCLEPPFLPFAFRYHPTAAIDDGRKASWLVSMIDRLTGQENAQAGAAADSIEQLADEITPSDADDGEEELIELQITLPASVTIDLATTEQLLLGLSSCRSPLSFEVIGQHEATTVQIACRSDDADNIARQIAAHIPDAVINPQSNRLFGCLAQSPDAPSLAVDFGLSNEFMLPLRICKNLQTDPLITIIGALTELEPGEIGALQVMFAPVQNRWAESIFRAVSGPDGSGLFANATDMLSSTRQKISQPLYAVCLRVAAQSSNAKRALRIAQGLGGALQQFNNPVGNELIPLTNDDYDDDAHLIDFLDRRTHRSGMILNAQELLSLVHLPSEQVRTEKLVRVQKHTKAAPAIALGHPLVLGANTHRSQRQLVTLNAEQRTRHIYAVGASGTGKSTFLLNCIRQDIESGQGLAVLDPHGALIDAILGYIPESRHSQVMLFDPSDEDFPIGFNILEAGSEQEKTLLASDLVAVFRRLSTSWGDQMNSVLANGIVAFLESSQGGTLADLRRFLVEPAFRAQYLESVTDPEVVYYWKKEFPLLTGKPQAPLLTRLDTFLRPKPIRHIVCQKQSRLDINRIMNEGGILLAKLAQGAIGEENAYLLGTLLVAKIHQTALARQELPASQRRDFWLYVDEFHNFLTPSMASILSGVRKFRLGLVLAHQELRQLGQDSEVTNSVLSNPYTRVCFRLGDADAKRLASGFTAFEASDFQNLSTGQAIARMERADFDFNLETFPLPELDPELAEKRQAAIRQLSRQQFASSRQQVEADLRKQWDEIRKPEPEKPVERRSTVAPPVAVSTVAPIVEATPQLTHLPPLESQFVAEEIPLPEAAESAEAPTSLAPQPVAKKKKNALAEEADLLGHGGREHKYLQHLITQWASGMGWRATIEKPTPDGSGLVDVALEKETLSVACEISVTTPTSHEVDNLRKCLSAGYSYAVGITSEAKNLARLQKAAEKAFSDAEREKLRFFIPQDLFAFLEQLEAQLQSREETVRGYKVRVNYQPLSEEEKATRKDAIGKVILGRVKGRLKKKGD